MYQDLETIRQTSLILLSLECVIHTYWRASLSLTLSFLWFYAWMSENMRLNLIPLVCHGNWFSTGNQPLEVGAKSFEMMANRSWCEKLKKHIDFSGCNSTFARHSVTKNPWSRARDGACMATCVNN
ncbi:hypothetical protein Peur_039754 [Populus x canadensis]